MTAPTATPTFAVGAKVRAQEGKTFTAFMADGATIELDSSFVGDVTYVFEKSHERAFTRMRVDFTIMPGLKLSFREVYEYDVDLVSAEGFPPAS